MPFRFLVMLSAVVLLGACSSTDDEVFVDQQQVSGEGTDIENTGPLADIYDNDVQSSSLGTQAELVDTIGDRVFFGYDRYDLDPAARATLESQASWLLQHTNLNIAIEGHADERGTREYNLALGERRANAVKNYLVAYGVDPRRVTTISYGKERPEVLGANESAWAQNRRSVTRVD